MPPIIAATSIYIAQHVLDCILTSDYSIGAANGLIVPGLTLDAVFRTALDVLGYERFGAAGSDWGTSVSASSPQS